MARWDQESIGLPAPTVPKNITIGDDSIVVEGFWPAVLQAIRDQGERIRHLEDQVEELKARRS